MNKVLLAFVLLATSTPVLLKAGPGFHFGILSASRSAVSDLKLKIEALTPAPAPTQTVIPTQTMTPIPTPTSAWNVTYDSGIDDNGYAVAVDGGGNVYVAGYSSSPEIFRTIKYNSGGASQWNVTFSAGVGAGCNATGIAVDGSGNVYVTGDTHISGAAPYDYRTIKYDSSGVAQWNVTYDGGFGDEAAGVAVDISGNVYVTGKSFNGSQWAYRTIKYNSSGVPQWNITYIGISGSTAAGVTVDGIGNVFVTGISFGSIGDQQRTIKYDSNGVEQWNVTYSGYTSASGPSAQGPVLDSSGNVYVTGSYFVSGNQNYRTIKYNAAGVQQWNVTYDSGWNDLSKGIALDASGNVYVTGNSDHGLGVSHNHTIRYDSNGIQQWDMDYGSGTDRIFGIAGDAAGNFYLAGFFGNGSNYDFRTIKY